MLPIRKLGLTLFHLLILVQLLAQGHTDAKVRFENPCCRALTPRRKRMSLGDLGVHLREGSGSEFTSRKLGEGDMAAGCGEKTLPS